MCVGGGGRNLSISTYVCGKPRINACVYAGDQTIKCVCGVGEGTKELIQVCVCVWGGGGGDDQIINVYV